MILTRAWDQRQDRAQLRGYLAANLLLLALFMGGPAGLVYATS